MPTCLVTGGAGFLGSHLCDELLARGQPRDLRRQPRDGHAPEHRAHPRPERFVALNLDITEPYFVDEPVDFVYHLASPASPIDYLRLPLHTLKVGSYGTHHTLGLAKAKRARFLIASTSEVYGDPQEHPQSESYWGHVNPIGPRGVYDEAKRYAEALTMAYHRQQGVDTAIVRIFNTYGSRMRPHDGRAIPTFLRQALASRPITVFGDGSQTRSFCYVADLIRGIIALAESGYHDPVNIGNPDEFTLLELAETVERADRRELGDRASRRFRSTIPSSAGRTSRSRSELLGWSPEVSLRDGLQRTIDAVRRGAADRRRRALTTAPSDADRGGRTTATSARLRVVSSEMGPRSPRTSAPPARAAVGAAIRGPSAPRRGALDRRRGRGAVGGDGATRALRSRHAPQAPAGAVVPAAHGDGAARWRASLVAAGAGLRRAWRWRSSPRWCSRRWCTATSCRRHRRCTRPSGSCRSPTC